MKKETTPKERLELAAWLFELAQHHPSALSEELLTNAFAVHVLEESLTSYIQGVKSRIERETDQKELVPKVTASCSIDECELEEVDVTLWFMQARDADLQDLREEDYGGESAEGILNFMAFFDASVETLLFRTSDPSTVCQVNQDEAEAWIVAHRPHMHLEEPPSQQGEQP